MDHFLELAQATFHQPPNSLNCAQSVAEIAGRSDLISGFRAFGGGRAEGNLCGALYAALEILPKEKREAVLDVFQKEAGATTCKEIKGGQKTPCVNCVALGAFLVDQFQKEK